LFDTIIVGAGPAGIATAVYGAHKGLNTLVVARDFGGKTAQRFEIANPPSQAYVPGRRVMDELVEQCS